MDCYFSIKSRSSLPKLLLVEILEGILESLGGVFGILLGGFIISVIVWTTSFVLIGRFHIILNLMLYVSDLIN